MEVKIAVLRGINVGGKRKILMLDLRGLFETLGFKDVKTYIQSGNVIFKSDKQNDILVSEIKTSIKTNFNLDVPVIIKSLQDLEQIVANNPFSITKEEDIGKLHLTFLSEKPTEEKLKLIESYNSNSDKFRIKGKNVFIWCNGKYHQSKLTNNFFEKKLAVEATTRNWKTVLKLLALSKE